MSFEVVLKCGMNYETKYNIEANTLDELKTAFLKRFGNIHGAPNKCLKEKPLVKKLTYASESATEWMNVVNSKTRWNLMIRKTN